MVYRLFDRSQGEPPIHHADSAPMTTQPDEATTMHPRVLPAGQIAVDAYWLLKRHWLTYAGQILTLSVLTWFVQFVTTMLVSTGAQASETATRAAVLQATYIAAVVTVLVLGGTAIFISSQRAIVLGAAPTVGQALRLQKGEMRVLRAVCFYWLVVHLVPTCVSSMSYLAEEIGIAWFPRLPDVARYGFYWGWVFATAPLVVLSLPITLFETAPDPVAEGRRRLDGNIGRLITASVLTFAPVAVIDILLAVADNALTVPEPGRFQSWFILWVLLNVLHNSSSFLAILVMSALVATIYLRLSPRLDRVLGVFD